MIVLGALFFIHFSAIMRKLLEGSHCASAASADEAEASLKWYYVLLLYIAFQKKDKLYCGFTSNLKKRIRDHRIGNSEFTSPKWRF